MNDYAKLLAHAAARFTGKPAVLSPLLDSYGGWENKKSRFSSEPVKGDFCIVLSASGISPKELEIEIEFVPEEKSEGKPKWKEGKLTISMQHGSKTLGDKNFKWSRDCTYKFSINKRLSQLSTHFAAYWTNDDFLIIQARFLENRFVDDSKLSGDSKFKLIPTEVIDVLEPALNVPFLKQTLRAIKKKSGDVFSYVSSATEIPDTQDVLALLTCIPNREEKKTYDLDRLLEDEEKAEELCQEGPDASKPSK